MPWSVKADPKDPEEAIAFFRSKVAVTDADFYELQGDARHMAFSAAGASRLDLVQDLFDAMKSAVENGTTLDDFKRQVGGKMTEAWGHPDAPRLETIFRTNIMGAYGAGRWAQMTQPDVVAVRPFGRFSALMDARVCPLCAALNGTTLPLSDPWWLEHNPPVHHQDRCEIENLAPHEAKVTPSYKLYELPPANEGFGIVPLSRSWGPDLQTKEAEIAKVFEERMRRYPRPAPLPHPEPQPLLLPPQEKMPELPPKREPPPITVKVEIDPGRQERTIQDHERKYCDLRKERGVIVTEGGDVLLDKLGERARVPLTTEECLLIRDRVFTHNHPSGIRRLKYKTTYDGQSLSPADGYVAARWGAKELRAVVRHSWNGEVYIQSIKPAAGQPWVDPEALKRALELEDKRQGIRAEREYSSGVMSRNAYQRLCMDWWHEIWRTVVELPEFKGRIFYERRALPNAPKVPKGFEVMRDQPQFQSQKY